MKAVSTVVKEIPNKTTEATESQNLLRQKIRSVCKWFTSENKSSECHEGQISWCWKKRGTKSQSETYQQKLNLKTCKQPLPPTQSWTHDTTSGKNSLVFLTPCTLCLHEYSNKLLTHKHSHPGFTLHQDQALTASRVKWLNLGLFNRVFQKLHH